MPRCPKISMSGGSDVAEVHVTGNPRNQEPTYVRIVFPGGDIELARVNTDPSDSSKAEYWCHVRVNREQDLHANEDQIEGRPVDARLDIEGKHASETNAGDFADPGLYHLAVRIAPVA